MSSVGSADSTTSTNSSGSGGSGSRNKTSLPLDHNQRMFQDWLDVLNSHDVELVDDMLDMDCQHVYGEMTLKNQEFLAEMTNMYKSFPDLSMRRYGKIEQVPSKIEHAFTVKCAQVQTKGTHTGAPYGFGPFPAMPAEGKSITTEGTEMALTVDDRTRKIIKVEKPGMSGPGAIYTQVGGFPLM